MVEEYLSSMKGKAVTVIGIGVSNMPLIRWLSNSGALLTARDQKSREALGDKAAELDELGVALYLGDDYLKDIRADYIFCTPGMRADKPEILAAVEEGAVLTSEMAVFFHLCPCNIIGITGSDGKTTTTTIAAEMMKAAGHRVWLGGNIGIPLLDKVAGIKADDWAVLELSSFQLMHLTKSPHIAIITNITPNHLDVHTGMEEYINAKKAVLRYQSAGDIAVLNGDNPLTREAAKETRGQVRFFSRQEGETTVTDGWICHGGKPLISVADIAIPGAHNVENYMAACGALADLVPPEAMVQVAKGFTGVEHRLEFVRELEGVGWYNDSIATSPTSVIAGLHSFDKPIILIAGGYDKKIPLDALGGEIVSRCKALLLIGDTAPKIRGVVEEAGYDDNSLIVEDWGQLSAAVNRARELAQEGDIVLLSPACASYDQFPNFEVRGRAFKNQVLQFI